MTQDKAINIMKMGHNVFLTGAPGAGKTYALKKFIEFCEKNKIPVAVTASTGIAACHMGGVTIHSWSGMGIKEQLSDDDIKSIVKKKYIMKKLTKARVLIIDEISMLSGVFLNSLDKLLRVALDFTKPFGGLQVILSGDFFQLPPIEKHIYGYAFESQAFAEGGFTVCYLEENYRHASCPEMSKILSDMRSARVSDETKNKLVATARNMFDGGVKPVHMFTHNFNVDKHNDIRFQALEGEIYEYKADMSGNSKIAKWLAKNIMSPENLKLRVGAVVMFTKNNFDKNKNYTNGTMGEVADFEYVNGRWLPIVETGERRILVGHESWDVMDDGQVVASVKQLPLRLAWAITVHKSQGMSINYAELDLSKSFEYGQGYVALSRVRTLRGLKLLGINDNAFLVDPNVLKNDLEFRALAESAVAEYDELSPEEVEKIITERIKRDGVPLSAGSN